MGSIGAHRDYLQRGNFHNLDEYDEEILNDQAVSGDEIQSEVRENYTSDLIRTAADLNAVERRINTLLGQSRLTPRQNQELDTLETVLNQRLSAGISNQERRRIRQLLDDLFDR